MTRLAALFEAAHPASVRRDFADPTRASARTPPTGGPRRGAPREGPSPLWRLPAIGRHPRTRGSGAHVQGRRQSHGRISTSSSSRCAARAAAWT